VRQYQQFFPATVDLTFTDDAMRRSRVALGAARGARGSGASWGGSAPADVLKLHEPMFVTVRRERRLQCAPEVQ